MNAARAVGAIALADFRERARRYSYFVALLFTVYLGYLAATGRISLRLGDYRGLYTSAWVGAMMSLVTTVFLSLIGFYIVKNSVDHDRRTGVGQILAATPLSRTSYILGKFFSNFAILASMVGVIALAALAMQFLVAEDRTFHAWALLSPLLLLSLPAMAFTAALAVFFETIPWLRGGFGNVAWFFLWVQLIVAPDAYGVPKFDVFGIQTVIRSVKPEALASIPGYEGGFALEVAARKALIAPSFHWRGVDWTAGAVFTRVAWVGAAFAIVLMAALFFDRFDPARSSGSAGPRSRSKQKTKEPAPEIDARTLPSSADAQTALRMHLTPIASKSAGLNFGRAFLAELRLTLKGYRWWWYAVALGLVIAELFAPFDVSRGPLLTAAWIWPVLIWSVLGTREARFGTQQLLFSSPRALERQLPAAWLAGVTLAVLLGAGVAVRLAIAGHGASLIAWIAGAVFIPSLALAMGVWSGTSRLFEALYTALWYVGPLNHARGLDFTGAASGASAGHYAFLYLGIAAALVAAAFGRRGVQLRGT
jgi:hypothetical protein